jgi:hypothetical protein
VEHVHAQVDDSGIFVRVKDEKVGGGSVGEPRNGNIVALSVERGCASVAHAASAAARNASIAGLTQSTLRPVPFRVANSV